MHVFWIDSIWSAWLELMGYVHFGLYQIDHKKNYLYYTFLHIELGLMKSVWVLDIVLNEIKNISWLKQI